MPSFATERGRRGAAGAGERAQAARRAGSPHLGARPSAPAPTSSQSSCRQSAVTLAPTRTRCALTSVRLSTQRSRAAAPLRLATATAVVAWRTASYRSLVGAMARARVQQRSRGRVHGVHRAVVPADEGHAFARGECGGRVVRAVCEQRALKVPGAPLDKPPTLSHEQRASCRPCERGGKAGAVRVHIAGNRLEQVQRARRAAVAELHAIAPGGGVECHHRDGMHRAQAHDRLAVAPHAQARVAGSVACAHRDEIAVHGGGNAERGERRRGERRRGERVGARHRGVRPAMVLQEAANGQERATVRRLEREQRRQLARAEDRAKRVVVEDAPRALRQRSGDEGAAMRKGAPREGVVRARPSPLSGTLDALAVEVASQAHRARVDPHDGCEPRRARASWSKRRDAAKRTAARSTHRQRAASPACGASRRARVARGERRMRDVTRAGLQQDAPGRVVQAAPRIAMRAGGPSAAPRGADGQQQGTALASTNAPNPARQWRGRVKAEGGTQAAVTTNCRREDAPHDRGQRRDLCTGCS